MSKLIDLTGKRFGRFITIKQTEKYKWLCRCDCGSEKVILGYHLKSGHTQSCGCLQKEKLTKRSIKHGHNKRGKITKIYQSWQNMKDRCTNPNNKDYKNYGGCGITVCKRWLKFENFLKNMIKNWKPGLTIERKDNKKGYYPDNCRWATQKEQMRNTRKNHLIMFNGKTQCLAAWAEEININPNTLYMRIFKYNWPIEKALITSVRKWRKHE